MLESSISFLHSLHLALSSLFEITNHDLNSSSSNHFWLNIVLLLKQHTKVNIHWFFIRNMIFWNIRLRLPNSAKEEKSCISVKKISRTFPWFPTLFHTDFPFSLTFPGFSRRFEKIPIFSSFSRFSLTTENPVLVFFFKSCAVCFFE